MTELRYIETEAQWDALPVGTLARVGYIEHDDNGNEIDDGKKMTILRVEGDFRANVGDYMLAGGKYWAEVWGWEQGTHAVDTAAIRDEDAPEPEKVSQSEEAESVVDAAIAAHQETLKEFNNTPYSEYVKIPQELHPPESPARTIVEALTAAGWAPPPAYPEGVQVWTISGIPDAGRSDGTQAYLSLPGRKDEHRFDFQDRGDIWLDKPTVTVNFEVPRKRD
ncbi:hypothetical protein [Pseudarthrobacter sp. BIM B-2242]|uniref:hypothetical protein n=1 Tax=Pseudarthrobacter sp. BIM B-2242 TaxID=2772401 RepID=UPI00168B3622|nr:hypothetical protein [Pseudarthrobacter sp. BIM B-2242]QOD06081.1 hypothetical protein IDT60_21195 [Pseudarthrobacter sp. BIM B-2242]